MVRDAGIELLNAEAALFRSAIPHMLIPFQQNRFASNGFLVRSASEARACLLRPGFLRPLSSAGAARRNPPAYPSAPRSVRTARHGKDDLLPHPAWRSNRAAARQKAEQVVAKLKEMKLADAAAIVVAGIEETLYYYAFPREHWRSLRTNNPLERLLREVRRRTRAVGAFPDGKSALMLAAARLRHVAGTKWGTRRYLDMNRLAEASEAA